MFKMLIKRNIVETLTIISCSGSLIFIVLHYLANISPITGIFFPIYVIIIFICSIAASFKFIQWVLFLNKPVKYDVDVVLRCYPFAKRLLPAGYFEKAVPVAEEKYCSKWGVIAGVLEKKLVSSWYATYVSEEISFPFACKQLLDQMIGKAFKISDKIDTKELYVDVCSIIVSHLKEYRKAIKRQEKSKGPIEVHYKKSHPIFDNVQKEATSGEHCTNVLRLLLKDVTPWELWDTSQSELLVRILSKKLDNFIHTTLTDPSWINNQLYSLFNNEEVKKTDTENKIDKTEDELTKNKSNLENTEVPKVETEIIEPIVENSVLVNSESEKDVLEEIPEIIMSGAVDIDSSPRMRQRRGRQRNNEVKIYDRIIEGSVKTWDTDVDLQCISLGQDLLASLDKDITLSRLWEQDPSEASEGWSPNPQAQRKSPQPLWFGEDDIELDGLVPQVESKKSESPKKDGSPNPADILLKDLHSTVTQAKHKIGDLQVDVVSQRKLSTDEAAGMMEGLLDFGIAGLKKGLRFTGLHDAQMKDRSESPDTNRCRPDGLDMEPTNGVMHTDDDYTSVPPLIKQSRVTSQDSMWQSRGTEPSRDSPEPEYEDSADLSSSIAKLRSLLHQDRPPVQPSISTWAAAEETRGRTHHYPCSKPVDTAALADEYDMSSDRLSPELSNNMQRLDKVFSRTVTGVFNSLRTVVRDEHAHVPRHVTYKMAADPPTERDLSYAMARLLGSIRPGAVDAAFDSLHHLNAVPTQAETSQDTLDYDEWCATVGARAASALEVCSAAGLCHSHVALRLAALLAADLAETIITAWLKELTVWLKQQVLETFSELSQKSGATGDKSQAVRDVTAADVCAVIMGKLPGCLYVFGSETLNRSVCLAVSSLSNKHVNQDIALRLLDVSALHVKRAATLRNLSFDNN